MSRATTPSGRATVASKTTFEALPVDSGEESENEQVTTQPTPPPERSVFMLMCATGIHVCPYSGPPKPSKSALKKAARTARTEKKQQEKAVRNRTPDDTPVRPAASYGPIKVLHESYEIVPATPQSNNVSQVVADRPLMPIVEPTPAHVDGMVHKYEDVISSTEPSYPTSMDTSGRTSPDALDDTNTGDPLNEELQLALQNKLDQQQAAERAKKKQNFFTRALWGFIMIGGFIGSFSAPFIFLANMETTLQLSCSWVMHI